MRVLVTGSAGFIGYHLVKRLIKEKINVVGIDNINDYYDQSLKEDRLKDLQKLSDSSSYSFLKIALEDRHELKNIFKTFKFTHVINLAAQAGVRYSLENPSAYIQSNIVGFSNLIEECSANSIDHFLYASSSSVYGGNKVIPFSESNNVDHPVSLYAATKRSNELIAHTYSHLYSLPTTGLRFFTVYGPWGRPDMALYLFTKSIMEDKPIKVFNHGKMARAFTYIDDIVESLYRIINKIPKSNNKSQVTKICPDKSWAPFRIFNIGSADKKSLMEYINILELCLGQKAKKIYLDMQPGDVQETDADTSSLENYVQYKPRVSIQEGIEKFVLWYRSYYGSN